MNVTAPRLAANLESLKDLYRLIEHDETISSARLTDEDISQISAQGLSVHEVRFEKLTATGATLEKTDFSDVEIFNSELITTAFPEASWMRVHVKNSRCNATQLQNSTLRNVTFTNCKLNLANFRFSKLTNVCFQECVLDEVDFYAAELRNVVFQNCTLHKTEFSGSKLKSVDLRASDISNISGIASLAGATISSVQLVGLAPLLAHEFKINIQD